MEEQLYKIVDAQMSNIEIKENNVESEFTRIARKKNGK